MSNGKNITITVTRYRPEQEDEPVEQSYDIEFQGRLGGTGRAESYKRPHRRIALLPLVMCRMGVCGSCGMMVNGEPKLSCAAFLRDYYPGEVRVEPLNNFPIVRDLIIDMTDFSGQTQGGAALDHPGGRKTGFGREEYLQTPEELKEYKQFSMCINCIALLRRLPGIRTRDRVRRPCGHCPGAQVQPGLPGRGTGTASTRHCKHRGHLGMHLYWRVLRGLPQRRGSRGRHPAKQGGHDRQLVQIRTPALGE